MVLNKNKLANLFHAERDARLAERYHALYVLALGKTISETATLFFRDADTIVAWKRAWEEKGCVEDESRSGRPPELKGKWVRKIIKLVDEDNPKKNGFNVAHWDCKELCNWLARKRILVSQETIRQVLAKNGFRYVKTNYEFSKADKKEQARFINRFKRVLRAVSPETLVAFMDEMSAKLHPKQGYVWTRNKKPVVQTRCSHKRVYATAAVVPQTGRVIARVTKKGNRFEFVRFLKLLLSKTKKRVLLFLDGHPAHKTKIVQDFVQQHSRLKLRFLPKYSPQLNPTEHLWGYTRQKRTNNVEFSNQRSLITSLNHWFKKIPANTVKTVCSYNCILGIT